MVQEWMPFEEGQVLLNLLAQGEVNSRVPQQIAVPLIALRTSSLLEFWTAVLKGGRFLSSLDELKATSDFLVRSGFTEAASANCVLNLLASRVGSLGMSDVFNFGSDKLCYEVGRAVLAGLAGPPSDIVVNWILNLDPANKDAARLNSTLCLAMSGQKSAQEEIVSKLIPLWREMQYELSQQDGGRKFRDVFGFPFEYLANLDRHAEALCFCAHLYYVYGQSGDEEFACRLAAKAAYLGNREAWDLLREWSANDEVLNALIAVGVETFCPPKS